MQLSHPSPGRCSRPAVLLFILYFWGAGAIAAQAPLIEGELRQWHRVSLTFEGPNSSETSNPNPFSDYRLVGTFTNGSTTYTVPGFYAADGNAAETSAESGNKWRIFFAPDKTGIWEYTISFTTGNNVAINGGGTSAGFMDGYSGSLDILPTNKFGKDNRAKGRLQYVGEHYLQYAGTGEWFVKAGADAPENTLAYEDFDDVPNKRNLRKSWSPHAGDYSAEEAQGYTWKNGKGTELLGVVRYLSNKGVNAMSFLTFSLQGDDHNVFPHRIKGSVGDYNSTSFSNLWAEAVYQDRFDVSRLAQWERIFAYADQKGIFLHFKLQETENDQLMDGGNVGRERKLYYRELIARFGHHLALNWNMGEENSQNEQQHKAMANYFAETDPYQHLRVIHTRPGAKNQVYGPLLGDASNYTGASLQTSSVTFEELFRHTLEWVSRSAEAGKKWVVAVDEPGNAAVGVAADPDDRKLVRHKVLWASFMAGASGTEYYYGYQTGCTDLDCQDHRSRDQKYTDAAIALKFFQRHFQSFLPDVVNDNGLTGDNDDYVLGKAGEAYAIYRPNGGNTSISLPAGSWQVQWYNPRTGSLDDPIDISNSTLAAPDNNDWTALILSSGCAVGASCNDGNACTENDVYDENCSCQGTPADADNDGVCDADDVCPGFDDRQDEDGDGIPNGCDQCDASLAGTPCDDGSACTENDVYDGNCNCQGTPADADNDGVCDADDVCPGFDDRQDEDGDGIPNGCDQCDASLAGTPCDDGNACTENDVYDENCNCQGTPADADNDGVCDADDVCPGFDDRQDEDGDGIPNGCDQCDASLAGTPCDDGNACTENDVYDENCNCQGTPADADNDGVCDADDVCPGFDDRQDEDGDGIPNGCDECDASLIGTPCDDGDPTTEGDAFDSNCECVGVPLGSVHDFWLEAECADYGSAWASRIEEEASEAEVLAAVANGTFLNKPPSGQDYLIRFSIAVRNPGAYALFARVMATNDGDDSFWVRVNCDEWVRWNRINFPYEESGLIWEQVSEWEGGNNMLPITFDFISGVNTIDFAFREPGIRIDKLYGTQDGGRPTGLGQDARNCNPGCQPGRSCTIGNSPGMEGVFDNNCNCVRRRVCPLDKEVNSSASRASDGVGGSWHSSSTRTGHQEGAKPVVFPNPVMNQLTIRSEQFIDFWQLRDVYGRLIEHFTPSTGMEEHTLDMSALPSGVYLLNVKTADGQWTWRVVKE